MASAENDRKSGFNTLAVVLCGLAAVFFAVAISLFLSGGYRAMLIGEKQDKIYSAPISEAARTQLEEQQSLLHQKVGYLDQEKGVLSMPIEDAMARVVEKNAK